MKTNILSIFALAIMALTACNQSKDSIHQASPTEAAAIAPMGNKLSGELLKTLKRELTSAMKSEGPLHAIDFCTMQALPLTDSIAQSAHMKVSIKRTSFKYRNPQNAPDSAEAIALNHFSKMAAKGLSLPADYVQRISINNNVQYNYYKPMTMAHACLLCHGIAENKNPDIAARIKENYPNDKATGYKEGDFRGLLRIKFTALELDD